MNAIEACARACEEPTLTEALVWVATWETERAVKQALECQRTGERTGAHGAAWDTCFGVLFDKVLIDWFHGEAPLGARPPKVRKPTIKVISAKPRPTVGCGGCQAILQFEFDDLEPGSFEKDWTSPGPKGVGIRCPECKALTAYEDASATLIEKVWKEKRRP